MATRNVAAVFTKHAAERFRERVLSSADENAMQDAFWSAALVTPAGIRDLRRAAAMLATPCLNRDWLSSHGHSILVGPLPPVAADEPGVLPGSLVVYIVDLRQFSNGVPVVVTCWKVPPRDVVDRFFALNERTASRDRGKAAMVELANQIRELRAVYAPVKLVAPTRGGRAEGRSRVKRAAMKQVDPEDSPEEDRPPSRPRKIRSTRVNFRKRRLSKKRKGW